MISISHLFSHFKYCLNNNKFAIRNNRIIFLTSVKNKKSILIMFNYSFILINHILPTCIF